jgi:DNA-binding protein H-NS
MNSNLASARALIQADLDHARNVMALWTDQVTELEKALEQINAVGDSRAALRGERQGQQARAPMLAAGDGSDGKAKRGRKPKVKGAAGKAEAVKPKKQRAAQSASRSMGLKAAGLERSAIGRRGKTVSRRSVKKTAVSGVAKYQDPASDKTWTGHGRRPRWMVGEPENYLIKGQTGHQDAATAPGSGVTDTEAMSRASA